MTNLAHKIAHDTATVADSDVSILEGAGTQLFTSGSAPAGSDMMTGDAVEMFTTSCVEAPVTLSAAAGEGVEMFTTSCIETTSESRDGDAVALFTTSC